MDEYIEKQAALKAVCDACGIIPERGRENCQYKFEECKEYYNVFVLPPANVRPVVRGRWKPFDLTYGRSIYACTSCGESTEVPTEMGMPMYRYCPECGSYNGGGV